MDIEFEATFPNISTDIIREKLSKLDATLVKSEFLQKRSVFYLPQGHEIPGGWLRVRDEGDKVTMSLKVIDGDKIENQKEICIDVNNFQQAELLLTKIGCVKKAYQESKREIWSIETVEVMIDEWPFLEPFIEIEGATEESVKNVTKKLDLDYDNALFCSVAKLYEKKYGISEDAINNQTPLITFTMENPFF